MEGIQTSIGFLSVIMNMWAILLKHSQSSYVNPCKEDLFMGKNNYNLHENKIVDAPLTNSLLTWN